MNAPTCVAPGCSLGVGGASSAVGVLGGGAAVGGAAASQRPGSAGPTGVNGTQAAGGAAAPITAPASGVPCNVAAIVSARCTGCHQTKPKFSAPMALMTLDDFHAAAFSDHSKHVFEMIPTRLNSTDTNRIMPPISQGTLPAADKQTFLAWVTAGAAASMNSCAITAGDATMTGTGTAGAGAAGTGVGAGGSGSVMPGVRSGGASIEPQEYNDPNMTCYRFTTHAQGSMTTPYSQAPGETYTDFTFAAPWKQTVYQRALKIVLDANSQVIHHWLLFKLTGAAIDGQIVEGALPTHPDAILLHGWAPGASPLYLDPDVGVALEAGAGIELEAHFNNATGAPGMDMSGADLCVTTTKPTHVAELAWVGTDAISGTSASGLCAPNGPFPIHIIAAQPHMHKTGTNMKVTINRANGMKEVLHDHAFSFDDQRYYIEPTVLNQGDTMTTDCTYSTFATFGPSTSQEMCYYFSLHWPAGSLRSPGVGSAIHGADSCL